MDEDDLHLAAAAAAAPDRPAVIMASSGETTTYAELDARSNQLAHWLRENGVGRGDTICIFAENHPRYLEVAWAAQRSGMYYTAINSHLQPDEVAYIADDCDAVAVVSSRRLSQVASAACATERTPKIRHRLMLDGAVAGWQSYESAVGAQPSSSSTDDAEGHAMLYSSGTTGRPKGIRRALPLVPMGTATYSVVPFLRALGFETGDVYLSPAPLYHAAPLMWSMTVHRMGGTVIVMERFDPLEALRLVETHGVTHSQFVPTMFVRMLKLDADLRRRYDLSSLRRVVHAAAPCPVAVKHAMIEWWGAIVDEFYGSTEGHGATFISASEWLERPGSVGRSLLGTIHVLDDDGNELPPGEIGTIWFEGGLPFEYHKDHDKTATARSEEGLATVGDVGYVDHDGYLYLTDRKAFMIISGGVNIYPQEIEDLLTMHPKVRDVGVIGVPDPEFGESVKAVVEPIDLDDAGPELESELIAYCRDRLAGYKCPRSVDFERQLPRLDTGKLYKQQLRAKYWT